MPALALRILDDVRLVSGSKEWGFVGKRGASLANNSFRWTEAVRKLSGLDFILHDLRRTCATGVKLLALGRLLGRVPGHGDRFNDLALNTWGGPDAAC